jgi:hypothetical protein
MPKVGGKSFPYTKKGMAAAKVASKKEDDKKKPKPKKAVGVKRRDVSDEQIKPRNIKPTPSRRRFLDELNEMNKRGGK